jgi:hypothetical protein
MQAVQNLAIRASGENPRIGILQAGQKRKRAACQSKRPKSREETPKEGSDSATAIAPQQYVAALHKTQGISDDSLYNYIDSL